MSMWLLYGAYGFSGTLIAEEAVRQGHRPVLAGRGETRLAALAARLNLDYRVFDLDNLNHMAQVVRDFDLVFQAAGPHLYTSDPMIRACTLTGAHYLDITGEIPVFENSYVYDEAAKQTNCAVICGMGFDVVPSNCLAQYVAEQVPGATRLEIAIAGLTQVGAGTVKTGLATGAAGGWIRRNGVLTPYPLGAGAKPVLFSSGSHIAMPIPWGDLSASYRSTGIGNITTYFAVPSWLSPVARITTPLGQVLLSSRLVRGALGKVADLVFKGPDEHQRQTLRSSLWARATDDAGHSAEAWLETVEPYRFTALAGVRAVERTLAEHPTGALTPAQAFGADFVLDIDSTQRLDTLEEI